MRAAISCILVELVGYIQILYTFAGSVFSSTFCFIYMCIIYYSSDGVRQATIPALCITTTGTILHTATLVIPSVPSDFTGTIAGNRHYCGTTSVLILLFPNLRFVGYMPVAPVD